MIFYTVIFNDEYIPYLKVLIESINQNTKDSVIYVGYDGLSSIPIVPYDNVIFKNYKFDFKLNDSYCITPGRKLSFLHEFVKEFDYSRFVFIDCDMLVLKSLDTIFNCCDFNIGYTYKTEEDEGLQYLINTGITLYNNCPIEFFSDWKTLTDSIQSNDASNKAARLEWGAADQAAFASMMGYNRKDISSGNVINKNNIKFIGFPCKVLNETRCTNITVDTHVIHYKSGWRPILKDGNFTNNRPKIKCQKMYDLWIKTLSDFNSKMVHA